MQSRPVPAAGGASAEYDRVRLNNRFIDMVPQVQATEAKAHLAALLRRVEGGATIAITRHGRVVAHLTPADAAPLSEREHAVQRFLEARTAWKPAGMSREEILDRALRRAAADEGVAVVQRRMA